MRKIKIIILGLGHDHARAIFESVLRQPDIFEVAAFAVPPSEEKDFADRIERYKNRNIPFLSVDEALNIPNLDSAVIETEEENLTKYAQMAADKGLNIHMDKPGGLILSDFERLIKTLKEKNLAFTLGYMYRFNPIVRDAIKRVKAGELGDIYSVEAHMGGEHDAQKRQWLKRFPGGMTFFLGCHLIDLIYRLQGEPLEVIPMNTSTHKEGVTADDFGMVLYKYQNGLSFARTCVSEIGGFQRRQLVIIGEKRTIEIRPLEKSVDHPNYHDGDQITRVREVYKSGWGSDAPFETSKMFNRYDDMMKNFAEIVCGEKQNEYDYDYELRLYKLILKSCGVEEK